MMVQGGGGGWMGGLFTGWTRRTGRCVSLGSCPSESVVQT